MQSNSHGEAENPSGRRMLYRGLLIAAIFVSIFVSNPYLFGWAADAMFALSGGGAIFRWAVTAILVLCLVSGILGLACGIRSWAVKCISVIPVLFMLFALWIALFSTMDRKQEIPRDAWQALRNPGRVVLYSIEPRRTFDQDKLQKFSGGIFHDHPVLGSVALDGKQAAKAGTAFRHALTWPFGMRALCFDPRHGLRVESGGHVYDFLVCYECGDIAVFRDDKQIFYGSTGGSARVLNGLLRDANVPLPKD